MSIIFDYFAKYWRKWPRREQNTSEPFFILFLFWFLTFNRKIRMDASEPQDRRVCIVVQLTKIMSAASMDAPIWTGTKQYWHHKTFKKKTIFACKPTDVCCAYKRVVLDWPLFRWLTLVHVQTPVQFVNRVQLTAKVHQKMDRHVARMEMFTIQHAKWNWWHAVKVWFEPIAKIVKALECVVNRAGVSHDQRVAQMDEFMRAHVKCDHQIVENMSSKCQCRTVCRSCSAQEHRAMPSTIVRRIVQSQRHNLYAAVTATFTVRCAKWKC